MKIIFLDIDGVLCTPRAHVAQGSVAPNGIMHSLDREAVGLVNALTHCQPVDVQTVLISTWRLPRHPVGAGGQLALEQHLRSFGWIGSLHPEWHTSDFGGEAQRGREVAAWLLAHRDISDYVILDDGDGFLPEQRDRLVRPNYVDGLSWDNFKRAVLILHGLRIQ